MLFVERAMLLARTALAFVRGAFETVGFVLARFAAGEAVRARNEHKTTHTRLPRYARGHLGTVVEAHGVFVLPDSNAHGDGENPEWLYTVRFAGIELWGRDADPSLTVMLDLWESYLDAA